MQSKYTHTAYSYHSQRVHLCVMMRHATINKNAMSQQAYFTPYFDVASRAWIEQYERNDKIHTFHCSKRRWRWWLAMIMIQNWQTSQYCVFYLNKTQDVIFCLIHYTAIYMRVFYIYTHHCDIFPFGLYLFVIIWIGWNIVDKNN